MIVPGMLERGGKIRAGANRTHEVIEHANEYKRGHIHTNGVENFWTLLKRTISRSYVSVDAVHLNAYVAEQA